MGNPSCDNCGKTFEEDWHLEHHLNYSKACKLKHSILESYTSGASVSEIVNNHDITNNAVKRFLREQGVMRSREESHKIAIEKGRGNVNSLNLQINNNLSWMVAVLYCDGSVMKTSDNTYKISLGVTDEEFIDKFISCVESLGLPVRRSEYDRPKRPNSQVIHKATAYSKKFYEWWESLQKSDIETLASQYPADFIRGVYDSDGCLSNSDYWTVTIVRDDRWLLSLIKDLSLEERDIKFLGVYNRENTKKITLRKQNEVRKFCRWVDPTISRKDVPSCEGGT